MVQNKDMYIVSACLLGVACRYDGKSKPDSRVIFLLQQGKAIPVCPEQLGGLPTPRVPAERQGDLVITRDGQDVTLQFRRGAEEVVRIAKLAGCRRAILKARSPSCGQGQIYDGSFSGVLTEGEGVCAALCRENGIQVVTEDTPIDMWVEGIL
jgi:uncharacterized protein YbbK (DUF523 family)